MKNQLIIGLLCLMWLHGCKTSQAPTAQPTPSPITPVATLGDKELPPRTAQIYVDACTEMIKGDYQAAIQGFQDVLSEVSTHHPSQFNIAKLSLELRNYDDAITYGQEALNGDSKNYWYAKILQQAYEFKGDYANTIRVQQDLSKNFPDKLGEQLLLVQLLRRDAQDKEALRFLKELEGTWGKDSRILQAQLGIIEKNEDWEDALTIIESLIERFPADESFLQKKFDLLNRLGRSEQEVGQLKQLLEANPSNAFAAVKLSEYYLDQGNVPEASSSLTRLFQQPGVEPGLKIALLARLSSLMDKGSHEQRDIQHKLLQTFNQLHPESSAALQFEARLEASNNQLAAARKKYLSMLESSSDLVGNWYELLELDIQIGDAQWLYADAEEALSYYPNQKQVLYYYGLGGILLNKWDEGNYALGKALRLAQTAGDEEFIPGFTLASQLGKLLSGDLDQAGKDDLLNKLGKEKGPLALYFKAKVLLHQNNADGALKAFSKVYQDHSIIYPEMVKLLAEKKNWAEANKYVQEAINKGKSPLMMEAWGDLLFQQGKSQEAEAKWREAIDLGAQDLNITQKLNQ